MSERVALEKLGDHNWPLWKYKVMLLLGEKGLADIVKTDAPAVPSKDWLSRDGIAQSVVGLALEDSQLCHVMEKSTAKEMWDSLQQYHERKSMSGKVYLLRRLISLRLSDKGNMADHLSQITMLVNRLVGIGEKLSDQWLIAIILSSLPETYNVLIMSLESRAEDELTLDFVKGRLLEEWRRRCEHGQHPSVHDDESVLQATKAAAKTKFKCHYCGKEGHYKRDCRKLKQDQQRKQNPGSGKQGGSGRDSGRVDTSEKSQKLNKAESDGQICFGVRSVAAGDVWFLDSGCTSHMTGDISKMDVVDSSHREQICLADGNKVFSEGIGDRQLQADDGKGGSVDLKLRKVLHVPVLTNNLLSVSKIADEGYEVVFDQEGCRIKKNEDVVVAGIRNGNLYQLKLRSEHSLQVTARHREDCQHLWHRRLGHRNPDDISKIVREDLGSGLKLVDCGIRSVCSTCCQGKLSCLPFPKQSQVKTKEVLDLVHTNPGAS